jgi:hypothetical protein
MFMNVILQALKEEHKTLDTLRRKHKHTYHSVDGGIFDLRENAFVYVVYKRLLGNRFFKTFSINWEDSYTENKHCQNLHADICITKAKSTESKGPWDYFEFGRYKPKKVQTDYKKLKRLESDNTTIIGGKYLVLYDHHRANRKQFSLEGKSKRLQKSMRLLGLHHIATRSLRREYPIFDEDSNIIGYRPHIFEIALYKVG